MAFWKALFIVALSGIAPMTVSANNAHKKKEAGAGSGASLAWLPPPFGAGLGHFATGGPLPAFHTGPWAQHPYIPGYGAPANLAANPYLGYGGIGGYPPGIPGLGWRCVTLDR